MSDGLRRMKSRAQVEPSPYRRAAYDSRGHFGIANGFVSKYLRDEDAG
jgi:hypothetical protein